MTAIELMALSVTKQSLAPWQVAEKGIFIMACSRGGPHREAETPPSREISGRHPASFRRRTGDRGGRAVPRFGRNHPDRRGRPRRLRRPPSILRPGGENGGGRAPRLGKFPDSSGARGTAR